MPRRSGTPRPTDLLAVVRYDRQACERSLEGLIPHRAKDINVRFVNSRPEPGIENRGSAMPSSAAAASGSWPSGGHAVDDAGKMKLMQKMMRSQTRLACHAPRMLCHRLLFEIQWIGRQCGRKALEPE
jgi:hypothetical protein